MTSNGEQQSTSRSWAQKRAARKGAKAARNAQAQLKRPFITPTLFSRHFFDVVFFTWYGKLIRLGWKRPLAHEDLPTLPEHCFTKACGPRFYKSWHGTLDKLEQTPEGRAKLKAARDSQVAGILMKTVLAMHWPLLLGALALQLAYSGAQFAGPELLNQITQYLQTPRQLQGNPGRTYMWAALMFLFPLIGAVCYVHSSRLAIISQIRIRAQLTSLVYRKALALSSRSRQQTEVGKIVNHMSVDVNEVQNFAYPFGLQIISAPIMLIVSLILLYFQIKWATFIGLAIMAMSAPASGIFVGKIIALRRGMLKYTDNRVKLMNQLLAGIRVLKIYAWEAACESQILVARKDELKQLRRAIPYKVGMQTMLFAAPVLAAVASFAAYGAADPTAFTPARIFTAISLFSLMRMPLIFLPFALVQLGNALVSMRRLTGYLVMEERADAVEKLEHPGAQIKGASFFWAEPPPQADAKKPKGKAAKKQAAADKAAAQASEDATSAKTAQLAPTGTPPLSRIGRGVAGLRHALGLRDRTAAQAALPGTADEAAGLSTTSVEGSADGGVQAPSVARSSTDADSVAEAKAQAMQLQLQQQGGLGGAPTDGTAGDADAAVNDATWWLRNVDLEVGAGELVCVVGRVGCGKTSLISALLGEMERHTGSVRVGGQLALVAQQAWIINASVRDNILLGRDLDDARWEACVEACCLSQDFKVLPAGADTEIGEKGINVSGGQKQRISLARACYHDADFYIMDDPLSAVDVHVGKHIFDECISGLLKSKTRLLVTNQLQFVPQADRVVYLEAGCVAAQGSFEEVSQHPGFASLLTEFNAKAEAEEVEELEQQLSSTMTSANPSGRLSLELSGAHSSGAQMSGPEHSGLHRTHHRQHAEHGAAAGAALLGSSEAPHWGHNRVVDGGQQGDEKTVSPFSFAAQQDAKMEDLVAAEALGDIASARADLARGGQAVNDYDPDEVFEPQHQQQLERVQVGSSQDAVRTSSGRAGSMELSRMEGAAGSRPNGRGPASGRSLELARSAGSMQRAGSAVPSSKRGSVSFKAIKEEKPALQEQVVMEKDGKVIIKTPDGRLIVQEDRAKGQVSSQVFREYAAAYGWYGLLFIICMWAMEQTCRVLTNWWLSRWSTAESVAAYLHSLGLPASSQRSMYLGVYVGLGLGYSLLVFMRSWSNALGGFHASGIIYRNSLSALIKAPMTFFDTTPIGRILNRFSKDTDDMDQAVPQSITELGNCLMQLLSTLIFISVIQPIFLAGMVPLMVVYYFLQMYYRRSYVELQRNDATTRSPVYAHFSETLTGVETVRAYGLQKKFTTKSDDQIDFNHRAYWSLKTADQWLSLRLDFIGACLVVLVALLAVANRNSLSASLAALSLSEILDVTGFLKYAVQSSAQFEARFNAVERILQYRKLEPESARKVEGKAAAPGWPSAGALSYRGVWMQYRPELDPVLKGISFDVAAGEKIGIVGRTGSGKSSLIVTLFRLVEPLEGAITLDGQNILELGLEDVRSRIAAIPQDPVLFSGTVRSNLDPYDRHADHELWEALGHVALKEYISALSLGLQARVSEGGDNFSTGQRQLLCVARALLRKPKVLVADEATAAVDSETDALIQRTIRSSFKDSTVLTIAHRLNTILDSTKVLVMDDGHVAEFDTPAALIAKRGGIFRAMVLEAGLTDDLDEPLDLTSLARQLSSGSAAGTLPR